MAYHGVKFRTQFLQGNVQFQNINELIEWCNIFAKHELAPTHPEGSYGNLSVRFDGGMLITATSVDLGAKLSAQNFVYVSECNYEDFLVTATGAKAPSSETPIHWALYNARPEIQAIFHGHDQSILDAADTINIPVTSQEQEYGSLELVKEVLALKQHNFFVMRNHGFISLGKTMNEAGNLALDVLQRLKK